MRFIVLIGCVFTGILALWSCSSSGGGTYTMGPTAPSATATTITIQFSNGVANLGASSFSPNPASINQGGMVVWANSDNTTHHIMLDDGSLDTGDIAPGSSSAAKVMTSSGGPYHCTIHPTMVGSITAPTNPSPSQMPGH